MKREKFTKIPNRVLAGLMSSQSFCEKTRVFHAILRKTSGWHKDEDWIALSQFEDLTGMIKPNVCRALRKLQAENIIFKRGNKYRINENTSRWESLSKRTPIIKTDKSDYPDGQFPLSDSIPTKETVTKDISLQKTKGKVQKGFEPPSQLLEEFEESMTLGDFRDFWEMYPRKRPSDKVKAGKLFLKLPRRLFPEIMSALDAFDSSDNWNKADGIFIPYPSTWIRDRKWEDDPEMF